MNPVVLLLSLCACAYTFPSSNNDYLLFEPFNEAEAAPGNVLEEAKKLGLNTLLSLVNAAGLSEQVTDNTLTVFAPNDEAFRKVPKHVLEYLGKNKTALQELLMYHAAPNMAVMSKDLMNEELLTSADPMMDKIRINVYTEGTMKKVTAEGARVVVADHVASNGVIHVVDRVMYPIPARNIAQYLKDDSTYFSTLLDAAQVAGITDLFAGPGPLTLFAPDNAAFKKLPKGALDALLKDKYKLIEVLSYHVVDHTIFEEGLTKTIQTKNGKNLMISMKNGRVMVNNAVIDYPDRKVTNGVIHVIDQVLMPQTEESYYEAAPGNIIDEATKLKLNTLVSLVKAAGLTDMAEYNQLTVMAPTDMAFEKLPKSVLDRLSKNLTALQEVLMYHAIPDATVMSKDIKNEELVASADPMSDNIRFNIYGGIITADGARVVSPDHAASNGIIHVIDRVMLPVPTQDIVSFLTSMGEFFNTLITAVKDAGLVDTLQGPGPFTLFAPDDAAFKKILAATLNQLLKNKTKLQAVLKYHVLGGTLYSQGIQNKSYPTVEGKGLMIQKHEANVTINGKVNVKYADLSVTNGVVHVIDGVLLPPM